MVAIRRAFRVVCLTGLIVTATSGCGSSPRPAAAAPTRRPVSPHPAKHQQPLGAWLGLAYNSSAPRGSLRAFAALGVVYDRSGPLEVLAGDVPARDPRFRGGLARSLRAGMVPDVVVDPRRAPAGCRGDPNNSTACLPVTAEQRRAYVRGFIATALAALRLAAGRELVLEPMNEPWNWGWPPETSSGRRAAAQYAAILSALLPELHAARVDLRRVLVPATGQLTDATSWIRDLYRDRPCLAPGRRTCGPIQGWNLHPYGRPGLGSEGIDSLPRLRSLMRSGRDNVVASEIGFCATDVNAGLGCRQNQPDIDASGVQPGQWLSQTLASAARMHRQGWLRALVLWNRAGDGWSMQYANGSLTPQGDVLRAFALSADARSGPVLDPAEGHR